MNERNTLASRAVLVGSLLVGVAAATVSGTLPATRHA
jgi:hypothetical protein